MGNQQSSQSQQPIQESSSSSAEVLQYEQDDNFKVTISEDFANEVIAKLSKDGAGQSVEDDQQLQLAERKKQYEQKLKAWREWNNSRQEDLDSKIDKLSAKYDDMLVEVKYDSGLLEKSWKDPKYGNKGACLDLRASVATCLKEEKGLECSSLIRSLEKCISQKIVVSGSS